METEHFALLFEFPGDKKKIRRCLYYCSAACPTIEGKTNEDSKEVQTETLEITSAPLPNGIVKVKTGANTEDSVYNDWYKSVYQIPEAPDEWLDQFGTFSIYQVLPGIIELWGLNMRTQVESKKTSSD